MITREYNSSAALIVSERNAKGWTQKELADRISLSTALVGCWETGDVIPTRRNAELVAEALGIDKEAVVMKAFVDRVAESRRKAERKIHREYASYPQVLKLAETMMNCPNCSDVDGELEKTQGINVNCLELALDGLEAGIYVCEIEGKILFLNEYLAKMLRTDKKSVIGRNVRDFDAHTTQANSTTEQILETGAYTGRIEVMRPDNTRTGVVIWCYLVRNANGDPVCIVGLVHALAACKEMINKLFDETSMIFNATEEIG